MANPALNLLGHQFGYLTVIRRAGTTQGTATQCALWLCQCVCGNKVVRRSQYLRAAHRTHPRSCGCHHGNETHKMSSSRPYNVWHGMLGRCLNPLNKDWKNYGGRGITVCKRWQDSFENFWVDMQEGYSPELTLGRANNTRGYSKANCRWETTTEQSNNTRVNRVLNTPKGRMTLAQAARVFGIKKVTLHARIVRYGWEVKKACNTPVGKRTYMT